MDCQDRHQTHPCTVDECEAQRIPSARPWDICFQPLRCNPSQTWWSRLPLNAFQCHVMRAILGVLQGQVRKVLAALGKEQVFSAGALAEFETVLGTAGPVHGSGVPEGLPGASGAAGMSSQEADDPGAPAHEAYRWAPQMCPQKIALKKQRADLLFNCTKKGAPVEWERMVLLCGFRGLWIPRLTPQEQAGLSHLLPAAADATDVTLSSCSIHNFCRPRA